MKTIKLGSIYGYYFIPRADTLVVFTPKDTFIWDNDFGYWEEHPTEEVKQRMVHILLTWGIKVGDL